MNEVFNLPQNLNEVGNGFANDVFSYCNGSSFNMNEIFNLPQNLNEVGDCFISMIFHNSGNKDFQINDIFKFPKLNEENLGKGDVFYSSLKLNSNCPDQNRTALTILNGNEALFENGNTFGSCFRDLDSIPEEYGGNNTSREVVFVKNNPKAKGIEEIQVFYGETPLKEAAGATSGRAVYDDVAPPVEQAPVELSVEVPGAGGLSPTAAQPAPAPALQQQPAPRTSKSQLANGSEVLEKFNLSENKFKLSGYKFQNWNTKPDGSGEIYKDKAKITLSDNLILYAQWKKNSISDNYDDEDSNSNDKQNNNKEETDNNTTNSTRPDETSKPENPSPLPIQTYTLNDIQTPEYLQTRGFINGYEDKTFRPEKNLTRAEAAQMFYKLSYDGTQVNFDILDKFEDVNEENWFSGPIAYLANKNLIQGFENKFNPNDKITRAEFSQMIFNVLNDYADKDKILILGKYEINFEDIEDSFAKGVINQLASNDFINGYDFKSFKPQNNITRAESVAMISRVFKRNIDDTRENIFIDLDKSHWAYRFIVSCAMYKDFRSV
jgi:hypothetical protein